MKTSKYSAVIIGSGIAGLYSALKIAQQSDLKGRILIITKSQLQDSNSYYAQGGMVAVLKENIKDSVESHISDTLKAGAGLSELNTVKFISENSDSVVRDLLNFGVNFDKDENGNFTLTKEAAHSVNRILHSGGDATGREIEIALCHSVKKDQNIDIYENTMAVELLVNKSNECGGVIVFNTITGKYETIYANAVILATGGIGQLYKYTTNPVGATGDGLAIAYRAGAKLRDMEFVQFHPTALAIDDPQNHNRFLISEAVRGEGAKLCNELGIEFMQKYDERKELAPRDIVARSIFKQMQETDSSNVYLNATVIGKEKVLNRFPTIAKKCLSCGIDITKDFIPVAPAAHYFMGGVETNLKGETSIKYLYAIGEVSSTGLHGANRLASNSLLECVVCAYQTAKAIDLSNEISGDFENIISKYKFDNSFSIQDLTELKTRLKNLMWENVGIFRSDETLHNALKVLTQIRQDFIEQYNSKEEYEFQNMLTVAELIIRSALKRK